MDKDEIATHLTIASIKFLQEKSNLSFKETIKDIGESVTQLYKEILNHINSKP